MVKKIPLLYILIHVYINAQIILSADPEELINYEYNNYINNKNFSQTIIRPQIQNYFDDYLIKIKNEIFFNQGAPNLENLNNRFVGGGISLFTGLNFSYSNENISFSIEPFYFDTQNNNVDQLNRPAIFTTLNDVNNNEKSYMQFGLRETQLYLKHNEYALGISNANMWWGPGIHSSLTMSNNTTGFPHLIFGTMGEKIYRDVGYNFKYILSQLDKTINKPYFSAFVFRMTFYSDPIITVGFNRNILLKNSDGKNRFFDLATIIFSNTSNIDHTYQIVSTYLIFDFPAHGLKVFFEIGTTDKWENFNDFLNYPDHGIASIFGFRNYGTFNNKNLVMGFEYARLAQSSFWEKRSTPNWYGNPIFGYSTYDGRRWAAHSGSDSDDLYIYFGYQSDKYSFIPSLNYERHGILFNRPPEVKMEIRLSFHYKWNDYLLKIHFEKEWLEHAGFETNIWRFGNVIWFGIQRDLTPIFKKN